MKNKKWFTLVEILLALMIAGTLVSIIMSIYISVKWADWKMSDRRQLLAESSDLIDKIHESALEYTLDYEEYFNRKMLNLPLNWTWFSSYWNSWEWYYCATSSDPMYPYKIYRWNNNSWWCATWENQKFWEYSFQFRRLVRPNKLNDKANSWSNTWNWPTALSQNTWFEYLYLINYDNTERYYFRRVFKTWIDSSTLKSDKLYTVQMLKLKWFDAGTWHDFDSWWAYDWFIDTWACDSSQWFMCSGTQINVWDTVYYMPKDFDDWWIDITSEKVTVSDFRVDIYPDKDPYLATKDSEKLFAPYVKLSFTMNMYWKSSLDEITITTTLWFKNSYFRYPIQQYTWYIPEDDI